MKFYLHPKQGVFLRIVDCNIPELKKDGCIIRNTNTSKMTCISIDLLNSKFKEIEGMKIEKLVT